VWKAKQAIFDKKWNNMWLKEFKNTQAHQDVKSITNCPTCNRMIFHKDNRNDEIKDCPDCNIIIPGEDI